MRVLFAVGSLEAGGLERFVTRMALRAEASEAFEPAVLCLQTAAGHFKESLCAAGVPIVAAPAGWNRSPQALLRLARLIRELEADVLHSQVNFSLFQQFVAARAAGVRFCVTERSCYQLSGVARLRRLLQFHALRAGGVAYSGNSRAVAAHLAGLVRAEANTIPVLPNGVPVPRPLPDARQRLRRKLRIGAEVPVIGYVARMSEVKGQFAFLDAFALLADERADVIACFVGEGPAEAALKRRAVELGLTDRIRWAGRVQNVDDYLEAFDIVALLSTREGMPNAVLEAMSAGKPVVATSVGGSTELLKGGCGLLVAPGSPTAAATALLRLVADQGLRAELGARARERAFSQYSEVRCFDNLLAHYRSLGMP